MDEHGMNEAEAFTFIQQHGDERARAACASVAERSPRRRRSARLSVPTVAKLLLARRQLARRTGRSSRCRPTWRPRPGQVTNAVFGFTSMLINLLRDHQPDGVAVAFDRPEPTFRHDADRRLQGQPRGGARHPPPADGPRAPGASRRCGIPIVELAGFEADDIIATLADRRPRRAATTSSSSPATATRYQLVEDPHVKVLYNRRGVSDYALYDEAGIDERTGVTPDAVPAVRRAARRPVATTCPACPGVGEKTAAKLITTYGGLDGIFANVDEQTPKLRAEPRRARGAGAPERRGDGAAPRRAARASTSTTLGDRRRRRRRGASGCSTSSSSARCSTGSPRRSAPAAAAAPSGRGEVLEAEVGRRRRPGRGGRAARRGSSALDRRRRVGRRRPGAATLLGLAVVVDPAHRRGRLARRRRCSPTPTCARSALAARRHRPRATTARRSCAGCSTRDIDLARSAARHRDRGLPARPGRGALRARGPARSATPALELPPSDAAPRRPARPRRRGGRRQPAARRPRGAGRRTGSPSRSQAALDAQGMADLYDTIENPLVARAGPDGARRRRASTRPSCSDSTTELTAEVRAARRRAAASRRPTTFNVNSPPQLREILFDELGLSPGRRRRRPASPPTPPRWRSCATQWPEFIEPLLRYREVEKLRGTYGDGLLAEVARRRSHPRHVQPDRRPHRPAQLATSRTCTTSRSAATRAASSARAFVPGAGLRAARRRLQPDRAALHRPPRRTTRGSSTRSRPGSDIHNATASRVFGVEPTDVTLDQRSKAKMVTYGLAYGMEAYGLGQRLNIPTEEAAEILDAYFVAFPNVKAYMDAHRRSRPASAATPRRCSVAAGRSPSCSTRTSASVRPASARR